MKRLVLNGIEKEIDEELKKPKKKRDYQRISELSNMYVNSCGNVAEIQKSREDSKKALIKKIGTEKRKGNIKIYKRIASVAACLVVFLGLNTASLRVFGQNMFSAMYQLSKDGITIDMKQQGEVTEENTDNYGMKEKCAEYNFYPETSSYIPNGFELADTFEESDEFSTNIKFFYRSGKAKLNFDYHYYNDIDDIPPVGIPTDTYNVTEEKINNKIVYILCEENQYTATYLDKNIVYCVVAHNIDYEIYRMILENMS